MTFGHPRPRFALIPAVFLHTNCFLGLAAGFASPARAAEYYVDAAAPPGGDGTAASPWTSVQQAIDAAADGDDIRVAGGTYAAIAVVGKQVSLHGGYDAAFARVRTDTPSIVEGTADAPTVSLFEVGDSVFEGFVIRGGQRGLVLDADFRSTTNKPVVRDNVIENNGSPAVIGGGVFADHCAATLVGNTVRGNVGDRGSGIASLCASLVLEGNLVEDNVSHGDHGGGLYLSGAEIVLRENLIRGNEVGVVAGYGWGAGATVYGADVTATFERNVFTDNHAQSLGSGAFVDDGATATFTGDLFFANACGTEGGAGLFVDGYDDIASVVTLRNVTIADHPCKGTLGNAVAVQTSGVVEIVDSIMWGNGGDDFATDDTSTLTATYTLSEEPIDGAGNLSADPRFADPTAGDFHVRSTKGRFDPATGQFVIDADDSPTIDAGDPASAYALEPGPNGLRVNLGHTGNTPEASMGGPGGEPPVSDDSGGDGGDGSGGGSGDGGVGDGDGSSGGGADGGGADAAGADDMIGCACASHRAGRGGAAAAWWLVVIAGVRARRRRTGREGARA